MVDPRWFLPSRDGTAGTSLVAERPDEVRGEQLNVAWHLRSLARLSEHLPGDSSTPIQVSAGWDERWVRPAIGNGPWLLWLDGMDLYHHVAWDSERARQAGWSAPSGTEEEAREFADVLADAEATYQEIVREDVPMLVVPIELDPLAQAWMPAPPRFDPRGFFEATMHITHGLGTGWWDLITLQLRLMKPYVHRALSVPVAIELVNGHLDPARRKEETTGHTA